MESADDSSTSHKDRGLLVVGLGPQPDQPAQAPGNVRRTRAFSALLRV